MTIGEYLATPLPHTYESHNALPLSESEKNKYIRELIDECELNKGFCGTGEWHCHKIECGDTVMIVEGSREGYRISECKPHKSSYVSFGG